SAPSLPRSLICLFSTVADARAGHDHGMKMARLAPRLAGGRRLFSDQAGTFFDTHRQTEDHPSADGRQPASKPLARSNFRFPASLMRHTKGQSDSEGGPQALTQRECRPFSSASTSARLLLDPAAQGRHAMQNGHETAWLSLPEAAAALNCSVDTVRRRIK